MPLMAHMGRLKALLIASCALTALASAGRAADDLAVVRGQTKFDRAKLPLVCLEIATAGAALPLQSIDFMNLETHVSFGRRFDDVSNFDKAKVLTAYTPAKESLSLPIFHLPPGRYLVYRINFIIQSSRLTEPLQAPYIYVGTAQNGPCFEVKADCVNYVGGIAIAGQWQKPLSGFSGTHDTDARSYSADIALTHNAKRDVKWAFSQVPCMAGLPSVVSEIRPGP